MTRMEVFRALVRTPRMLLPGGPPQTQMRGDSGANCRAFRFARLAVVSIAVLLPLVGFSEDSVDVHTIIERSVHANNADWQQAPEYDYFETDRDDQGTKTYQVTMILGSPYERLVAINEKPLPPDKEQAEKEKLEQAVAARQKESAAAKGAEGCQVRERPQARPLADGPTHRGIRFQLKGTQKLGADEVYVLQATPRAGYQPPNTQAKVLTGMEGQLWIETKTYQWVKVEATVIHPVSIAGFLARVEPGTRFELEKVRVTENVWLPKHFTMKASAKVLMLFNHNATRGRNLLQLPQSGTGSGPILFGQITRARVVRQADGRLFERDLMPLSGVILSEPGSPAAAVFAVAGVDERRIYAFFLAPKYMTPPLRCGSE